MSAFIVDKRHLDVLIQAAFYADRCHGLAWYAQPMVGEGLRVVRYEARCGDNEDQVGQMLVDQNVRSVMHRYGERDQAAELPGPVDAYWREPYRFSHSLAFRVRLSPVEVLKAIDCYEYQACETADWEHSEAAAFCDALRRMMIHLLPGYDAAPWVWYEDDPTPAGSGEASR